MQDVESPTHGAIRSIRKEKEKGEERKVCEGCNPQKMLNL